MRRSESRWPLPSVSALAAVAAIVVGLHLLAQEAKDANSPRLIDQPPFDVLTLDKANDSKVVKVEPLNLPGRRVPDRPKGSEKLRVKLLADGDEYEVAWANIAKVELFEQAVLADANKLAAAGKFDEAYDHFAFLLKIYPNTPGLPEGRQNYLYLSAGAAFREKKYEEALAILEELLAQNPNYRAAAGGPSLIQVLGNIADPILAALIDNKEYASARALLTRLAGQYRAENEPFIQRRRQQLIDLATRRRDEARAHLDASRFVEAHDASRAMQSIWPDLEGAAELVADVARRHALIIVGVDHPALTFDSRSLHNVSARRAGRLTERLLVDMTGLGPEGGQYEFPLGAISRSEDGLALFFRLQTQTAGLAASDLAQRLLARADPTSGDYQSAWGEIVAAVQRLGTSEVRVDLKSPHVLPEALLREPLPIAPFAVYSRDAEAIRYTANPDYALRRPSQPAEIVERYFDDPEQSLRALKQGEINVLGRVFPDDIASLQAERDVVVAPYGAPTTHLLLVRSAHPFLASKSIRRALLYGSNRELLLQQGLLRGKTLPGFRVVSGPFPAPSSGSDLPTYGYDRQIEPRSYDPRLALTLRLLAEGELKAAHERAKKQVPALAPLILGHPADEVSRITCRGLASQWKQIGIECNLLELPPGVFDEAEHKCDLLYVQLAAWEPIVDAQRLLGADGLAPAESPFIQLTLRQISSARNWQQARERLLHLHRLLHEEVTVLPLWQMMDHFAYRRGLQGIGPRRLRLYQDVEQWQAATQLAGARP